MTPTRLGAARTAVTEDEILHNRAAAVGAQIRAENGAARAVELLEQYVSLHHT
jgi:hypothetical protein